MQIQNRIYWEVTGMICLSFSISIHMISDFFTLKLSDVWKLDTPSMVQYQFIECLVDLPSQCI